MKLSVYTGEIQETWTDRDNRTVKRIVNSQDLAHLKMLKAFLADNEISEMSVTLHGLGSVYTYKKLTISEEFNKMIQFLEEKN